MPITPNDSAVLRRILNPNLPEVTDDQTSDDHDDAQYNEDDIKKVKQYEKSGVEAAEQGNLEESLKFFNMAIQVLPDRASGYNNRAQAKRMLHDVDGALIDLNTAIELSRESSKVRALAFTQRASIFKFRGQTEEAKKDFQIAADLGNPIAKQEMILNNPYAALCNQMLSQVFEDTRAGKC